MVNMNDLKMVLQFVDKRTDILTYGHTLVVVKLLA